MTTPERGWQDDAACRGCDTNIFFPIVGQVPHRAKQICASCSVSADCLEFALANHEKHGIYGGKSESERERIRRQRRMVARLRPLVA